MTNYRVLDQVHHKVENTIFVGMNTMIDEVFDPVVDAQIPTLEPGWYTDLVGRHSTIRYLKTQLKERQCHL
jgi:hypothetical protein